MQLTITLVLTVPESEALADKLANINETAAATAATAGNVPEVVTLEQFVAQSTYIGGAPTIPASVNLTQTP